MAANNETGVIQPVRRVVDVLRDAAPRVLVHSDAVQAFVSEDVTVSALGVDLLTLASHKVGGPKGVGLLYVRDGVELEPVLHGGGQELGRRSGTHDVAGIVGMVAALEAAAADRDRFRTDVGEARRRFEHRVTTEAGALVTGSAGARLVQHAHVRLPGRIAETMVIRLDHAGVAVSAGSACQSGAVEVSHVLHAMGFTAAEAAECLRFSFGWTSSPDDGDRAATVLVEEAKALP
jgi:cysteine desulfurase